MEADADASILEYSDAQRTLTADRFLVESHRPRKFRVHYHHHASIEVNFLSDCEMDYSFSGRTVTTPIKRMIVFWGAMPHGVTDVRGDGQTTNMYVPFTQVLAWRLPSAMVNALIGGDIIASRHQDDIDVLSFRRWAKNYAENERQWGPIVMGELAMRFRRLALEGWDTLSLGETEVSADIGSGASMRYIEGMLRFIADNYVSPITVADVAGHVGLSHSYAMGLFRKVVGVPIKEHITRIRLSHAQMLLASSDMKILSIAMDSGFGSLSSFYEAFQGHTHKTPAAFRRDSRG